MRKIFVPVIFILFPIIIFSQVNLNAGLLANYTFNGNANDVSGSNFHGNVQGAQLTSDRFGNPNSAYYFDGIDDRIVVTDNGGLSTPSFSLVYYFMTESATAYQNCIGKINYVDGNGGTYNSGISPTGTKPYFATFGSMNDCFVWVPSTLSYTMFSPTTVQPNVWHCVVNTFDNGSEKMYIDGVLVNQSVIPITAATFCTNTNFVMGSWWEGDPYRFKGKMDDVRYYNRALNAAEVAAFCTKINIPCTNWLSITAAPGFAEIGDLDVPGNKLTVEAVFNRTTPFSGGDLYAGNLVSKHDNPATVNYLLRPNSAEITTSNGYFIAQAPCGIELNTSYHVAMVYDGATLKFFRNGFLMAQVPATGNLYQSNLKTRIGWLDYIPLNENFIGYINEVRIWNVARSLNDIRTYMNSSLPNPPTQAGLLGYYTFDNLLNKQGNTTYNAILNGSSAINQTNPACDIATDSCTVDVEPIPCNNWLNTPSQPSWVNVGDIDVAGDQLTVEGLINIKGVPPGGVIQGLDVVSKHTTFTDVNYLLRSSHAELSTTSGYFFTPENCDLEMNKTYHVAMVYNGSTLKYYRNGFLFSQVPATGNMIQSNLPTGIGFISTLIQPENFIGFINNVRIWNVARSQQDIQTYMNTSLPDPASQAGLVANYIFNDLTNKQGNTAFNGTLMGSATINQVNPECNFIADSCGVEMDSIIINKYTPVISLDLCKNYINVENASEFNIGDTVLMIQMKGAVIDSTNTASFGNITNYRNAGNYEFNYIQGKTGNLIELRNIITRQYDLPDGKVQLVRVPYYNNANFTKVLTCLPWDGRKGGVLVFNVRDSITMAADMDVSGRGFEGGNSPNTFSNTLYCARNNYNYPVGSVDAAAKGESITTIGNNILWGKGAPANAGGGGLGHNSGGGGGGNAGIGGLGGYQLLTCGNSPYDNRGLGAHGLTYSNEMNRIFMGGGGGSSHVDNIGGSRMRGGNGGGIIIINSPKIIANSFKITANGSNAPQCSLSSFSDCHDASGGGGGGGAVVINSSNYASSINIEAKAGNGSNVIIYNPAVGADKIGPGGGGGGGIIWLNNATVPAGVNTNVSGGNNGVITLDNNNPWGATPGANGSILNNLVLPISTAPFKANIDSVRFNSNAVSCSAFDFNGLGFTNTSPIASWNWTFGDGGTATTQNSSHTYTATGTFVVKLVVTDINGCKDSISRPVNTNTLNVSAGNDDSYCSNTAITHTLNGTGGGTTFNWQPAALLNDNSIANPVATISSTTKFYLTKMDALGCSATDSVVITVNPVPILTTIGDTAFCANRNLVLNAGGAATYIWSPAAAVSNPSIANPTFIGSNNQTLTVTGTSQQGCPATASFDVTVKPVPVVNTIPDSTICNTQSITLTTTGAQTYSWSPAVNLSNANIANPVFNGSTGGTYTVTGTAVNGCSNTDIVNISTRAPGSFNTPPNTSVCVNSSVTLNGNNGTGVTYLWSPAATLSNTSVINPVATPLAAGTAIYNVLISENICNSSRNFAVTVNVNSLPPVDASRSNDLDCSLRTSRLTATGALQYSWTPAATLTNAAIGNPVASPTVDTKYIVTGTDANGCKNKDSVMVLVKNTIGRFDIPNSFTPNGDGTNDCFGVKHWGETSSFQFIIFNRWGEKVFETNNINNCWDGRHKGMPADVGGYVYYIKAKNFCTETTKKGNVLLIR